MVAFVAKIICLSRARDSEDNFETKMDAICHDVIVREVYIVVQEDNFIRMDS